MRLKNHTSANANVNLVKMAIAKNVIAKIANAKTASVETEMPFKSKAQMKACWASKGFGGKVDCGEWMSKTKYNKLPEKINKMKSESDLPFKEIKNGKFSIRKFSENLSSDELHWHRDKEDRIVKPLNKTDWLFQRENQLPEPIVGEIKIKAGEWHRVIKGSGDLEVVIEKFNDHKNQ